MLQRRTPEPGPSVKERLRALRQSALEREAEYKREIQSMETRVRAMPLLLERQAVAAARRRLEQQYERKLKELGLSYEWIREKAQQPRDRQPERRVLSATQGSETGSRFRPGVVHRCPAVRTPPPEATAGVVRRSRSASCSLRSALSRTESASDLSASLHDGEPEPGVVASPRTPPSEEET
ncbi:uncharacterized protein [Dermacentor andersoni]|uniref:uncharacterized protein n=1 Tax=Dermacentor andersoni TaxID=34620 RepID=UPI002416EA2F|nr:uncharacterized protein LOC126534096 [Dermacentor andersoni]